MKKCKNLKKRVSVIVIREKNRVIMCIKYT